MAYVNGKLIGSVSVVNSHPTAVLGVQQSVMSPKPTNPVQENVVKMKMTITQVSELRIN